MEKVHQHRSQSSAPLVRLLEARSVSTTMTVDVSEIGGKVPSNSLEGNKPNCEVVGSNAWLPGHWVVGSLGHALSSKGLDDAAGFTVSYNHKDSKRTDALSPSKSPPKLNDKVETTVASKQSPTPRYFSPLVQQPSKTRLPRLHGASSAGLTDTASNKDFGATEQSRRSVVPSRRGSKQGVGTSNSTPDLIFQEDRVGVKGLSPSPTRQKNRRKRNDTVACSFKSTKILSSSGVPPTSLPVVQTTSSGGKLDYFKV